MSLNRKYLEVDVSLGWPAAPELYYECRLCGDVLPSAPNENTYCKCRNVIIDVEAGRLSVKNTTAIALFQSDVSP